MSPMAPPGWWQWGLAAAKWIPVGRSLLPPPGWGKSGKKTEVMDMEESLKTKGWFVPSWPGTFYSHFSCETHKICRTFGQPHSWSSEWVHLCTKAMLQTRWNSTSAKFGVAGDPRAALSQQNVLMAGSNPSHSWEFKHSKVLGPEFLNTPNPSAWLVTNNPTITHSMLLKAFPNEKFRWTFHGCFLPFPESFIPVQRGGFVPGFCWRAECHLWQWLIWAENQKGGADVEGIAGILPFCRKKPNIHPEKSLIAIFMLEKSGTMQGIIKCFRKIQHLNLCLCLESQLISSQWNVPFPYFSSGNGF